ncbi:MFS transporter [Methylobacterium nodulans]|uniref:Major facilitator superfamily MFS_1 n=1 Tax=Methylobacterium nodulans (strain LMG 21967 / CNCM I-2342 / ORS 2060) TaxID=460265 RepID=B8IWD5_METNO|nr:MFS transporter [Methylobacterium nodulans]ACL62725.1 major facilitator superfamily MFS_1 [Methylobacterium nodulans ORS 2060]
MTGLDQTHSDLASDGIATPVASTVRWRIFGIIFVLVVINLIDRVTLSIAMPTIAKEFAIEPAMQGLVLSAFFWSYALLQIPGGWLIDRFGPRALIAGATVGWGFFQAVAGLATGGVSLLASRIGLGAAEAPLFPAGAKLNSIWLSPKERARGAVLVDSGAPLGAAFGGVIIAWLILSLGSWRTAFVVAGLVTMLLGVLAWWYLRDDPTDHPGVNAGELAAIQATAGPATGVVTAGPRGIAAGSFAAILVGRMSWAMINFGLLTWGPSYLAQARGFDLKQMGGATFVIFLAGMVGSLTSGFLVDRLLARGLSRGVVYKWALGLTGLGVMLAFLVLPQVADPVAAVALLSATLFLLYFGSLYWSLPAILAPKDRVGVVGGAMNFAGSASGIAIPIITGLILQATGAYLMVLYFFAACAALYVAGSLLIDFKPAEAR